MEEYLEKLLSQIRCKKARPYIESEFRGHLEDQIEENKANGMSDAAAEKCAVLDMGDPVEVGVELDQIHKPRVAWTLLLIMLGIAALSVLLQFMVYRTFLNAGNERLAIQYPYLMDPKKHMATVAVGLFVMLTIFFLDYTWVAKHARILGVIMLLPGLRALFIGGFALYPSFSIARVVVSTPTMITLFIPVYAGILFHYRHGNYKDLLKVLSWIAAVSIIQFRMGQYTQLEIVAFTLLLQLTISIQKGWFEINRRRSIVGIWGGGFVLPNAVLWGLCRAGIINEFVLPGFKYGPGKMIVNQVKIYSANVVAVGGDVSFFRSVEAFDKDYFLTTVNVIYGGIAGGILVSILAMTIYCMGVTVRKQKNELAFVMGIGCTVILGLMLAANVLAAIGMLPLSYTFLPFFSSGGNTLVACYALLGIVLNIYRYKDIYPKGVPFVSKKRTILQG